MNAPVLIYTYSTVRENPQVVHVTRYSTVKEDTFIPVEKKRQ